MELIIIPTGQGKYTVTDTKDRKIYSVTKKKKFVGMPVTTLHDVSGYALYTLIRTESGVKPAFQIIFNDAVFLHARCRSFFVDPAIDLEGDGGKYTLKGREHAHLKIKIDKTEIGSIDTEKQANNQPKYILHMDDKYYDDYVPLFAVVVDKCFNGTNK